MPKNSLITYDDRPFFERVLRHGVRSGVIDQGKMDEILENGPTGMVQIARTFGTEYLRPDLQRARNRIVNLVSLSLENASGWDVEKAAGLLAGHTFLSHSKGGSNMIKSIHSLPEAPILGEDAIPNPLEESYDRYAPDKEMSSWVFLKYKNAQESKMRNKNIIQACEWLMAKFPHLHRKDFFGYNAEWVLATLLLFSMDGFHLRKLPTKHEIENLIRGNKWRKIPTDMIMGDAPDRYAPYLRNAVASVEKILRKKNVQDSDIHIFESGDQDMDDIEDYAAWVDERWQGLTGGKRLTRYEIQTILFSFLSGGKPQTDITNREARKMVEYLVEHTPEHTKSINDFIENNIPFEFHEAIKKQWSYLSKEIETLYEKDILVDTKIWILNEAGCNIIRSRIKSPKKVTNPAK